MNNIETYNTIKYKLKENTRYTDSREYFDILFSTPLNYDEEQLKNKLILFCPYFLDMVYIMHNPKVSEYYSGVGVFLKLVKKINTGSKLYFINSQDSNSLLIAENILFGEQYYKSNENEKLDVILSDGIYNLLTDEEILKMSLSIVDSLNNDGLFLLLINLDPSKLRKDFDIFFIHNFLQDHLLCIWGKNTFSSLWLKK